MQFDNAGMEEDGLPRRDIPAATSPYSERIRFAIALLLAPLIGVLGAFLLIALKLQ